MTRAAKAARAAAEAVADAASTAVELAASVDERGAVRIGKAGRSLQKVAAKAVARRAKPTKRPKTTRKSPRSVTARKKRKEAASRG